MDSLAVKTLPKGFVLDVPAPPPGYVLDAPPPPPGFVLDRPGIGDVATGAQDWRDSGPPVSQNAQLRADIAGLDPKWLPQLTTVGQRWDAK